MMQTTTDRPTKGAVRVATIITNGRIRLQKTRRYLACDHGNKSTIGVADMIDEVTGLGQALDALRAVLPYAEQELAGLRAAEDQDPEILVPEADQAEAAITAVRSAIDIIDPDYNPLRATTKDGAALTPARAQYLWQTRGMAGDIRVAYRSSYLPSFCMQDAPLHPDGLTEAEDLEVKGFWRRMREGRRDGGGNTCWSDAFWRIMRGLGPNEPCGSCSPYPNYGDRGIADAAVLAQTSRPTKNPAASDGARCTS